jgi:hypothetical protein
VPSLVEIDPVVLEKILKYFFCIFLLFCYYLPLEKGAVLHLKKLESPSLVEIGPVVLEKILKYFCVFLLFCYYLPLEKGAALHLNKLESPPLKYNLCQV